MLIKKQEAGPYAFTAQLADIMCVEGLLFVVAFAFSATFAYPH
jgi:hypothetical protein